MRMKILQWMIVAAFVWVAWPWAWWIIRAAIWLLVVVWRGLTPLFAGHII